MSTWIKLHDNFATNLKVLAAGEDAAWLYVCGLLFCSANETDGKIPTAALRTLTAKKDARTLARILVREGLWVETGSGWEVHDYLKVQRSKAQIEAEREKARTRKARSRSSHTGSHAVTDADVTQPEVETDTETDNPPLTPPGPEVDLEHHPAPLIPEEARQLASAELPSVRAALFKGNPAKNGETVTVQVSGALTNGEGQ